MKRLFTLLAIILAFTMGAQAKSNAKDNKVIVAYVTSWTHVMPDPFSMTHINYAFGGVNKTFNGVDIANPDRLRQIVALKKINPKLKVELSIGGWGAGRFSEMAASADNRHSFAANCGRIVKEFNLDGIDIDWEYPTQSSANISSSPDDTKNYTLMMAEIRKAIGKKKLLTCATVASGEYIDFPACIKYIDLVNVMSYDMANPPKHHSALYPSNISGWMTGSQAIENHIKKGVPKSKLVMGVPFYGRGDHKYHAYQKNSNLRDGVTEQWCEKSQVPYFANRKGELVYGYENTRSLAIKCQYIIDHNLRGAMYWEYADDNAQGDERTTLALSLLKNHKGTIPPQKVLVIAEEGTPHQPFCDAARKWLDSHAKELNIELTYIADLSKLPAGELDKYHLLLQINYPPYNPPAAWSKEAGRDFERYIDEGHGSYIGFHHASLLGDIFGAGDMWKWYSDFMGGIRWKNYIAPLADGTVDVEDKAHPIMKNVPDTFRIPKDEWYTYDVDPRPNVHVLAHVDEASYSPASDIRMGDHPVIWTNEKKAARNVYFQIGHSEELFQTPAFVQMFENAIRWALFK